VQERGELTGERAERYAALKEDKAKRLLASVASDLKRGITGVGGCYWEDGADPSTAKCSQINPDNPAYVGYAQPVGTPMYTDQPGSAMRGLKPPPKLYGNEDNPRRVVRFMA
jgi:hypothetical protein